METALILQNLGVAVGLGLLVGLQREYTDNPTAGIRTFALITLLGALAGILHAIAGPWVIAAGLASLAALVYGANLIKGHDGRAGLGMTTSVSILVMYVVGVMTMLELRSVAVVVAGGVMVLLQSKHTLHTLVDRLGEKDIRAIMQLVLIALVILPILPDRTYGPFDVLNPKQIWLMAVLIVGISLGAYVAYKAVGPRGGSLVHAVLGGLISSTATTVSAARQSVVSKNDAWTATMIIVVAAAISLARVMGLVAAFAPSHYRPIFLPLSIILFVWVALGVVGWIRSRNSELTPDEHTNPANLRTGFVFAALYAVILFAVAAAKHYLGNRGLFIVAGVSGLTDLDAITISTARITELGEVAAGITWKVILIAMMSNTVFKLGTVAALGSKKLLLRVGVFFAVALVASGVVLGVM